MSHRNYVIATDSRTKEGETLFLVDRHRRRDVWWSNELKDALMLTEREAHERLATIHLNNPRIMNLKAASRKERTA